ncbi:MAG: beta-N-acetylhexosaminidase [Spirochaetes bacterium]|nr:beta-N-acetylhexosaminidase [Spirochaetota bacterium]
MKKRLALVILSIIFLAFSYTSCPVRRMHREASTVVKQMTLEQKIGMLLMIGVPTNTMTREVRNLIAKYQPGGIILFRYNISDRAKTAKFIEDMQEESMKVSGFPLFISLDQESGRVIRVVDGATQFPGAMAMGICDDEDLVKTSARILGLQLRQLGINMNLAPVLDVNNNPKNPVINTRAFGSSPVVVSRMGVAYVIGLQGALCIAVGKHFPGHGDTSEDSHFTLPIIPYPLARLMEVELVPFIRAIERGIDGIMTAHIAYPEVLKDAIPATLSPYFLTELLRKNFGFEGIIMTDDMEMHAISKNYDIGEAAVKAIQAGADIILISSYGSALKKIQSALRAAVKRGDISQERLDASVNRIIELKLRYKIMEVVNGKIVRKKFSISKEDAEILEHAESVNRKISRMAIYAHGFDDEEKIFHNSKQLLYVITDDAYLKSGIAALCGERAKFIASSEISTIPIEEIKETDSEKEAKKKTEKIDQRPMVLFHVHEPNESAIRQVAKLCNDRKLRLCILSTGNPFPLAAMEDLPPTIFTFSATKASLDELAECISGSFEPKRKINFDLGFPKSLK